MTFFELKERASNGRTVGTTTGCRRIFGAFLPLLNGLLLYTLVCLVLNIIISIQIGFIY